MGHTLHCRHNATSRDKRDASPEPKPLFWLIPAAMSVAVPVSIGVSIAIARRDMERRFRERAERKWKEALEHKQQHLEHPAKVNVSLPGVDLARQHGHGGGPKRQQCASATSYVRQSFARYQNADGQWVLGPASSAPGGAGQPPTPPTKRPGPQPAVDAGRPSKKAKKNKKQNSADNDQPLTANIDFSREVDSEGRIVLRPDGSPQVPRVRPIPQIWLDDDDEVENEAADIAVVGCLNPSTRLVVVTDTSSRKRVMSPEVFSRMTSSPNRARLFHWHTPEPAVPQAPQQPAVTQRPRVLPYLVEVPAIQSLDSDSDGTDEDGVPLPRPRGPKLPVVRPDVAPHLNLPVMFAGGVTRSRVTMRGLNHFTPQVRNACTLDTVLTAVIFRARRFATGHEGFIENYFRLAGSRSETALAAVIRNAVRNPTNHDDESKALWARDVLDVNDVRGADLAGDAMGNFFDPLSLSEIVFQEYSCLCPNQRDRANRAYATFFALPQSTMSAVAVAPTNPGVTRLNTAEGAKAPWSDKNYRCGRCQGSYRQHRISVPQTTWMLHQAVADNQLVTDFARTLTFPTTESADETVTFELGVVMLSSRATVTHEGHVNLHHQTGLLWLDGHFYHYDDMRNQVPVLVLNPNTLLASWSIDFVVYFRH